MRKAGAHLYEASSFAPKTDHKVSLLFPQYVVRHSDDVHTNRSTLVRSSVEMGVLTQIKRENTVFPGKYQATARHLSQKYVTYFIVFFICK